MDAESKQKPLHENLDTTFVNLWSLLRSLRQKNFIGRVRVELKDYLADIFMNGEGAPLVREIDRAAGTEAFEPTGLHRVVLRARETPGTISVFEGADEAMAANNEAKGVEAPATATQSIELEPTPAAAVSTSADNGAAASPELPVSAEPVSPGSETQATEDLYPTGSYQDWPAILEASGELIAAIERAVNAAGEKFEAIFGAVRLELADDYSFLDPIGRTFEYANGVASLNHRPAVNIFVSGLSEALRRTVDGVAAGERGRRVRERVALEILTVARKRSEVLERSGLGPHLDRIAGTRVI